MNKEIEKKCYELTEKIINIIANKYYKQLRKNTTIEFYDPAKIEWFFDKFFHEKGFYFFDGYVPNGIYEFNHIEAEEKDNIFIVKYQLTHAGIPSGMFMILKFDMADSENLKSTLNYCLGMPNEKNTRNDKKMSKEYKADKERMTKEEFLIRMKEDEEYSPGWQAIDDAFAELYPEQEPKHYGTLLTSRAIFGGDCYLDGISIYDSPKGYKHLVSYGMTVLYGDEEAFGGEWNGWGYEMTMKLKETDYESCMWAIDMMLNLARYTYKTERFFEPNQYVKGDGTSLHTGTESLITSLLLIHDTEVKPQMSVYGKTEFIQLVGITESELKAIIENHENIPKLINLMKADGNTDLITDMGRTKSYL